MKLNTQPITLNSPYWEAVNVLAVEAFPPEEYLAPATLFEMAKAENFDFFALLDGEDFVGFMVVQTHKDLAYLFFLAIDSSRRSRGYGSRTIETLKASYPDKTQVVDFEMLDSTASNYEQRKKRRNFYLRNGYFETGHFLSYLGVNYEIFSMDKNFVLDDFKELMSTLRIEGFNPIYFYNKMSEGNMKIGFIESYKQLEKLCGDILNDDRRVSAYIDEMMNTPDGSYLVKGWKYDLKRL